MDKVVWITGANSGIGRSMTLMFARNGYKVVASARRIEELKKLCVEEGVEEGSIIPVELDVINLQNIEEACNSIEKEYQIAGLINNAGISSFKPILETSNEDIEKIISTNLLGAIYLTKMVVPKMIELNEGRIINIISVVTKKIFTNSGIYSASKAGLEAFSNVLREELRGTNVRVTNVSPGATKTPIWPNKALEKHASQMINPDHLAKLILDVYNLKDNLVVEDLTIRPIGGDL